MQKKNNINTNWFSRTFGSGSKIVHNKEGHWSIDNKKNASTIFQDKSLSDEAHPEGIFKGSFVSSDDVMETKLKGSNGFLSVQLNSVQTLRDGALLENEMFNTLGFASVGPVDKASKAIVIGEGMGAIRSAAKSLQSVGVDAKWYQAWSKNFTNNRLMTPSELKSALARNARWLKSKINSGYKIYDIGIDATRASRSPFYQLEKNILDKASYPTTKIPR